MLGPIKHNTGWIWYASGKHPAAKDFLQIGPKEPLLQAFADWVAGGYRQLAAGKNANAAQNSWRFWAKAARKKHLICGLSRDSCDSFGRSFPLVILGSGPLKGWEAHWELLPLVLDNTWLQIEYLSIKRFLDFRHMENEIRMLPFPTDNWSELNVDEAQAVARYAGSGEPAAQLGDFDRITPRRPDPMLEIIPLNNVSQADQPVQIAWLHALLKKHTRQAPNAVFMGGVPEKSCLILFRRPLRPDDFVKLWSSCWEAPKKIDY